MATKNLGKVVPEKGVDYWTEEDKQEILDEVAKTSLPEVTEEDNGKVLQVADGAWVAAESNALPEVTEEDNGKVLQVADGAWVAAESDALPEVTEEDNGKVLQVVNGVWVASEVEIGTTLPDAEGEEF